MLSGKTVFYVDGDSGGYYALPELKVPFQSGLGQVLMVSYSDSRVSELFKESSLQKTLDAGFLYDTVAQGYKEKSGVGFGYFWDKNELMKTIKKYNIPVSSVYGFYYLSDSKALQNITSDLRKEITSPK